MMLHSYFLLLALPAFLTAPLLSFIVPLIAGPLNSFIYQYLKKGNEWTSQFVGNLPPQFHGIAIAFLAFVVPQIAALVPGLSASTVADLASPTAAGVIATYAVSKITYWIQHR